jgi:sodium/pantothenate symporter
MVAQFKGVGVVFSQMFGISFQTSVVVFAVIVAAYLAFGGFFAVAWTDAVQGFIMMAGMLLVGITAIVYVGGFGELNAKLAEINPEMLNFTGPKQWLWLPAMLGAWGVVGLGAVSVPYMIVRFITYKQGPGVLGKSVVLGTIAHAIFSLAVVCGLIAAVVIPGLKDFDTAMPSLILKILHPALAAFILAAIVAAVMSTVDSGLILVGQSFARDIYQELISSEEEVSQARLLVISRVIVVVVTAISAVLAFWPPPFLALMLYLGFGVMGSTFLCALILGLWWKRVNFWGALAGFIVPLSVYLGDRFWNFTGSGFIRYLIAVVLGLIATVVLSLLTPAQSKEELRPVFGESA